MLSTPAHPDQASHSTETPSSGHSSTEAPDPRAPRFSFIIITYNYGTFLARAIDSILAQEGEDYEVVVVDDGSTDETRAVAERYGPEIRYLRREHAGASAACREAFAAMRSRWAIFVDADDRLCPGALRALRTAADAHPQARLVLGCTRSIDEQGRPRPPRGLPPALALPPMERFARFVRGDWPITIAGGLLHRSLLAPFDRPEGFDYPHGMDVAVAALTMLHPIAQTDAVTLDIHAHPGRLRDNIGSIDRSGLRLAEMLFDPAVLPAEAMGHRESFIAWLERERARAYCRAKWHGPAWQSSLAAWRADPMAMLRPRHLRRAIASGLRALARLPEGPVADMPPCPGGGSHHRAMWADPVAFFDLAARAAPAAATLLKLPRRTFLLREPDDARHVLVANDKGYIKSGILMAFAFLAGGMIGMQRPRHAQHRRVIQPALQKRSVHAYAGMMVEKLSAHVDAWAPSDSFNAAIACKWMSGDVAATLAFGPMELDEMKRMVELVRMTHQCAARELSRRLRLPAWVPLRRRREYRALMGQVEALLQPLVERAARGLATRAPADDASRDALGRDMLSVMLMGWDEPGPPTAAAVRDRVMTLFTAGFEPVAVTLTWAIRLLGEHPVWQDRLAQEAAEVWAGRKLSAEDLPRLAVAERVAREVMRLYPSEPLITRRCIAEDRLPSGLRVRPGEEVIVSPRLFQRDPRFFPEPERFDPDRFARTPTWPADAMIPFGMGPRVCIGEHFARMEIVLGLSLIAARWRIEVGSTQRPGLEIPNLFSSQPTQGQLYVRLIPR